jgi:hypothetical protein
LARKKKPSPGRVCPGLGRVCRVCPFVVCPGPVCRGLCFGRSGKR